MIALPSSAEESTPAGRLALLRALFELRMPARETLALLARRGDPDAIAILGDSLEPVIEREEGPPP